MSRTEEAAQDALERRRQIDADLSALLPRALPEFLRPRRWFAGKARTIAATALEDVTWLPDESLDVALAVVRVEVRERRSGAVRAPPRARRPSG